MDSLITLIDIATISCLLVAMNHIRLASNIHDGLPRTLLYSFFLTVLLIALFDVTRRSIPISPIPILGTNYVRDILLFGTPLLFLFFMNSLAQSRTLSELESKGAQSIERERMMEIQQAALLKLSRYSGDTKSSIRLTTELAAKVLNVSRVSVWLYDDKKSRIICQDLFLAKGGTHLTTGELLAADFPVYFKAIESGHVLDASDAANDERTREFADNYLAEHNIKSMLDIPLSSGGTEIGVLCCESQASYRDWTIDEKNFTRAVSCIISLHLEVEENKRISNELRIEKDTAKHYFDTVEVLIVGVDLDGKVNLLNRKTCELLGYSESELMGKRWTETCVPEYARDFIKDRYVRIIKGEQGIPKWIEDPVVTKSGEIRMIRWRAAFQRDADGKISGGLTAGEDVTDHLAQAEEKVKLEKQMQQMQKMETIGRLTGGIAHDFNNMLASILGYAEMAKLQTTDNDHPEVVSSLEKIYTVGQRAAELVSQMMVYTRTNEIEMQATNLNSIIKESLSILQSTIPSSIEIRSTLSNELPQIRGNAVQLQQVIMNLALNSRDALDCENPIIEITSTQRNSQEIECNSCYQNFSGDFICLTVKDNGTGIDPGVQKEVFNPFVTTKESGKGTGMGLSTVHGIVHMHGGHLTLQSEPGLGTTIKLFFPLPNQELIETMEAEENDVAMGEITEDCQGKRVLLVDDEEDVAKLIADFLTMKGIEVSMHTSSEAALAEFEADPDSFSAVVTDQTMPKVSGLELIEKVRDRREEIPVVICSGYNDLVSQDRIDNLGISQIYQKPVSFRKLVDDVASMIQRH